MNVLILGYYGHANFGDDLFQYIFENYVFKQSNVTFTIRTIEDLSNLTNTYDKIIIGGGDLVNKFFFTDEVVSILTTKFSGIPIIFYGTGITYFECLKYLDLGDYFFMRNSTDHHVVSQRYTNTYTTLTPDIGFLLGKYHPSLQAQLNNSKKVRKIGFSLPYTWFAKTKSTVKLVDHIASMIRTLSADYHVYLLPFDTSRNTDNSDLILLDRLELALCKNIFDAAGNQRIFLIKPDSGSHFNVAQMISYFKSLDLVFASRFHSVIMSILTDTPFVSLYTQPKIDKLKDDIHNDLKKYFVKITTNNDGIPVSPYFDIENVICLVKQIDQNYVSFVNKLTTWKESQITKVDSAHQKLLNVLNDSPMRVSPPSFISDIKIDKVVDNTVESVLKLLERNTRVNTDKLYNGTSLLEIISRRQKIHHSLQQSVTEEVLWCVTGDPYGPYYYGLYDNILTNDFIAQVKWVIEDYNTNYKLKTGETRGHNTNIEIINKNFQNVHRSGWQYILDHIVSEIILTKPLVIDSYVDKTFHWNCDFYRSKGLIPYTKTWVGFIHHTFSDYNNNYNCTTLFQNPLFIKSLETCKGLIVMTNYLARQIQTVLQELNIVVRVYTVYHPSETTNKLFSWEAFCNNTCPQVVQIGNWSRDVFSIYKLHLPSNSIVKTKSVLKNRNTDNYFLPKEFFPELFRKMNIVAAPNTNVYDICKISFDNMHLKGLYNYILQMENSVDVVEYLDNVKYDDLLVNNIVYIDLIDASAVNTIIECILRNTPILVNPIDPVREVLGENYPLYYNNTYEASKLLENPDAIHSAHMYLIQMDKTRFLISTFITQLKHIIEMV